MKAEKHALQESRIKALQSYKILDTEPEPAFDDVVKLAADLCDAPISVVNFIDEERQWFKAETGLGVRETPLETSICSHVILQHDFVEIEDTLLDHRMVDNPLCCSDPGLRFYAGALLKTDEGLPLGTLCVLDHKPRKLTELQKRAIKVLADQVMAQLNLRRAVREADLLRKEVDHRVKNSLQSIESLARMSARKATDETTRDAISVMAGRIASVSQVHELLYQSNAGQDIDLKDYIARLVQAFEEIAPSGVELTTQTECILVSSRTAGSLGLLMNEFVTNSFKHAFPDGQAGRVEISAAETPSGKIAISLRDTGVGMDETVDGRSGLGKMVLQAVCRQLGCEADLRDAEPGVILTFEFEE